MDTVKKNYALFHVRGCGGPVFFIDHMPELGEVAMPSSVTLLDGTSPSEGTLMICGTCCRVINQSDLSPAFFKEVTQRQSRLFQDDGHDSVDRLEHAQGGLL
jgi:hypothetical protein